MDINTHDPLVLRDRAMLEVIYSAALRLAELVGLNCADVDLSGGEVRVVGKGNKELEHLLIGAPTVAWLTRWLALRDQYTPQNEAVFIAQRRGTYFRV